MERDVQNSLVRHRVADVAAKRELQTIAGVCLIGLTLYLAIRVRRRNPVVFGLLVWVPLLLSDPRSHTNWSETAETYAIAGAAWLLADLLAESRLNDHRPR